MEAILLQEHYVVEEVIDCSKQYDTITRVNLASGTSRAVLDVHNKLFPQICKQGAETDLTLCCQLIIDDTKTLKATDKVYGGDCNIQKAVKGVNYCMHGTIFEFTENSDDTVTVTISFGGLLLALTCKVDMVKDFKYGQQIYLLCCNTK